MADVRENAGSDQRSNQRGHSSFIYFFAYSDQQRIKIGSTTDPFKRWRQLNDGAMSVLALVPGTEEQEHALHDFFDAYRQEGQREQFWYEGDIRAFVEYVMTAAFSAKSLDQHELDQSWAPPDWLPWMQATPREFESQGVLVFPGFDWARRPPVNTSDEYYTREEDLAPARALLGEFELDVASHPNANRIVRAKRFLTIHDEALHIGWHADTVWMNPPYSLSHAFTSKLIKHYEAGDVHEAVAFLSARSVGDHWFHEVDVWRYPLCFRRGRARFDGPNGKGEGAHFGHLWLYLGRREARFTDLFAPLGAVVRRWEVS